MTVILWRSEEHTSELQSHHDLVILYSFPTRRSSDLDNREQMCNFVVPIESQSILQEPVFFKNFISRAKRSSENLDDFKSKLRKAFLQENVYMNVYLNDGHIVEIGRAHV